jgi:hypothetical protein
MTVSIAAPILTPLFQQPLDLEDLSDFLLTVEPAAVG